MKAAVVALSLLAATLSAPAANACMREVMLEPSTKPAPNPSADIAAAERALDNGTPQVAAANVAKHFAAIKSATPGQDPLQTRAIRVMALAAVRSDGALSTAGFNSKTDADKAANLEWAVSKLFVINTQRPNDPAVQADLGEAMAKVPAFQREALRLLGNLADKDLMGSPQAYAALAKLRATNGDANGAEAAFKRCETMSTHPATCRAQPAATTASPAAKPAAKPAAPPATPASLASRA